MFERRLFSLVPQATPYIMASVLFKWIALMANITVMWMLARILGGIVTDGLSAALAVDVLAQAALPLAAAIIVRAASIYLAQRAGDKAAFEAVRRVRSLVYDKLTALGPSYTETVPTAEAVQTSVEGATQLQVYFGGYLPQLFFAGLAPITLFVLLVGQAGLPAALLLACVPVIPVSIMMVMRNAKKIGAEYWGSYVDLGGMFLEAVQGLTTLKVYQADRSWHERINAESERFRTATMRLLVMQLRSICVMDLVVYMGAALGIIVAAVQLASGKIGFEAAFLIVFLSQEFFLPMRRLGSLFHTAMNGMAASRRMFGILDTPEPERGDVELDGRGDIELAGVSYAYGDRTVLDSASATIAHGSLVALVGESGGGKSTLAGIISGRKDAYRGSVRIGGVELRDATATSLMRAVTLVPTNGYLFAGTLRDNLLIAQPSATDTELLRALDRTRVAAFVQANGGLDMVINEGGTNLSGGQRQRVCMARALLHDSPIYVFDEATSNVDAASEAAIGEVIASLAGEHTVIVVAHRLSTIVDADQILVLERGRIAERGTHGELLATAGAYARMWNSQEQLSAYAYAEDGAEDVAVAEAAEGDDGRDGADMADAAAAPGFDHARRSAPSIMWRMMGLVRPLAGWLVLAVALGSIGMLTAAFVPAFGAFGLMAALGHNALGLGLVASCAACAACGITRGPLHYGEQLCNHYIAFRLLAHIRDLVFGALRQLAPAKLEGRGKGELVSLVTSDIELLEVFYAHTISPIAIALVCTAVFEGFLLAVSPELAGIALVAYAVLGVLLPLVSAKACGTTGRQSREGAGKLGAFVLDSLRGASETIQFAGGADRSRALGELTEQVGAVDARLKRRQAASEAAADALILVANLVMLGRALQLVAAGTIDFAAAFVAVFTFVSSFGSVMAVSRLGASLQETLASGARVLDLLDEQPQCAEVTDGQNVEFAGAAAEHVSFSYVGGAGADDAGQPADETAASLILDDVTCTFAPGTMTCIMGRSGSGKSTLLKLLMRFWDPTAGTITVSGVDARRINTASLRGHEAYMTQDTHLFCGTVRENLLVARADATDAELLDACRSASLTTLIDRLPQGLDTPVAELGDSLSGGERQRIGLARIFLNDAPFILLDEPTSALDALNEASVMKAVDELKRRGKTIVLVSHRASTCAFADRSLSVEHGRLS
ncbi:ATP-binding cassette domain-containing protein [Collinsella aerofaciens]|uniref:ATP-binding cassette domain-containing protein n=1 Tax=Collinsella aerofaciens TaxID=74426 RepID=UPI0034A3052C